MSDPAGKSRASVASRWLWLLLTVLVCAALLLWGADVLMDEDDTIDKGEPLLVVDDDAPAAPENVASEPEEIDIAETARPLVIPDDEGEPESGSSEAAAR